MRKTEINYDFIMGSLSTSPRATGFAANVMDLNIETGEQAFTEKEQGPFRALAREPIFSVLTAMIPMSQNLSP
jgi:hypothetical protein